MWPRLILALAIVSASVIGSAQAPVNPAGKPDFTKKPEGNCTVSGRVVSAADGNPLRSARVGLVQSDAHDHPQIYAETTDDEGRFALKKVLAGRYRFFATHVGYLDQSYKAKTPATGEGAVLALVSGQEVLDVVFRLTRAGVIAGRVVDDTGEPIAGVNVTVLRKPSDEELEQFGPRAKKLEMISASVTQTDDRGEYRIFGLKPGEYYVKATEVGGDRFLGGEGGVGEERMLVQVLGSQFAPMYFPGVLQLDQAQAVVLQAGEEAQADFAMRHIKLVEVAGRVLGTDGGPETRAYVHLEAVGVQDWSSGLGSSTDSKGDFSIKGVPPGTYYINTGTYERGKVRNTRKKIDVGEANVDSIVLSLAGGATIHGRVAGGNPQASQRTMVMLQAVAEDVENGMGYSEVEKDGSFEIQGVADGNYAPELFGLGEGWFVKSAHIGSEDAFQKGIQVEDGAAKGSLEIVVSNEGAQIEGAVTDSEKNQPLVGVQVKARVDPETDFNRMRAKQVNTDQNGHFVLKDMSPGKYKITAKTSSPENSGPVAKSEAVPVMLGDREHRTVDITIKLPSNE